ncbi:aquaporin-like protein [Pseudovirgaria hyperparasitica]|uniref:Aquaporin-like protein n=1 Tax=Pseudovirgaria hyperparasitica TaxID=470096 RepID=A0A6A6W9I5_9PEZI|nr:aquaporin-like protein [Pseudovirgaria hyperparasitica]KAF2758694.1 aquaporin-like protein [Pseudovirgaria hyperparasitica]
MAAPGAHSAFPNVTDTPTQRGQHRPSEVNAPSVDLGAEDNEHIAGPHVYTHSPFNQQAPEAPPTTLPPPPPDSAANTPVPTRSGRRSQPPEVPRWHGYPTNSPHPYRQNSFQPPPRLYGRYSYDPYQQEEQYWDQDVYYGGPPSQQAPGPYQRRTTGSTIRGPPPMRHQNSQKINREDSYDQASLNEYNQQEAGGTTLSHAHFTEHLKNAPPKEVLRLPWTMWMNSNAKNHFVATVGEFVGTFMFLFFAFSGTQVANVGSQGSNDSNTTTNDSTGFSPIVLLYISLVFSFSLLVNVWVFFRVSGGLFNPAVTLAMLLTRTITLTRAGLLLVAQLAGSIFASYIVSVLFPTQFNVRTTLSPSTSLVRGVFIEAVLTAELVFTIFMLAKEKHKATFIAPVGIGLSLFIGELVGVYYTGGSLNPARSFGPCVVTATFDKEHWIYWVGPGIGALLAIVFYQFIKVLEYEVANPGQDSASVHEEAQNDLEAGLQNGNTAHNTPAKSLKETSPKPAGTSQKSP